MRDGLHRHDMLPADWTVLRIALMWVTIARTDNTAVTVTEACRGRIAAFSQTNA